MIIILNTMCRHGCHCPLCSKTVLDTCLKKRCADIEGQKDSKLNCPKPAYSLNLINAILNWNVHLQYMVIVTVWLYLCTMDWRFSLSEPSRKPWKNHQTSRYHKPPPPPVFTVRLPRRNGWKILSCYHGTGEATCAEGKAFGPTPSIGHGLKATSLHIQISCHKAPHSPGRKIGKKNRVGVL